MTYLVQKYGGSSVATARHLIHVAQRITESREGFSGLVVVVSAMGQTTNQLIALAQSITQTPSAREMDMLLSTGENISAPLLAMALSHTGVKAISLTGLQAGIKTTAAHRKAHITDISPTRILQYLQDGYIVVVAGFQGVTDSLDITTLGRGGSDTSAVALAVAIGAVRCEIYTDVPGVFTADPRIIPTARVIPEISYEEMLELAFVGAKVMHPRAIEIGAAYSMPIIVRSTFDNKPGTRICKEPKMENRQRVRSIAHDNNVAKVTILGVPDQPGVAANIFIPLGNEHINVDIIVQNVSHSGLTDLSFTIAETDLPQVLSLLDEIAANVHAAGYETNTKIAKISAVGTGMLNAPGMFAVMFKALGENNINIHMISTSEIHLTCIIDEERINDAVNALHHAYSLDML